MKKYIALLCMAVLCLQLAACDLLSDGQDPKYDQLIQDLESGNYVQAQAEFNKLVGNLTADPANPTKPLEKDPYAAETAAILGTWRCATEGYCFTFFADGSGEATLGNYESSRITWKWDGQLDCYIVAFLSANQLLCGVIEETDGLRYFVLSEEKVYHSDCYEEAVKLEYRQAYEKCLNHFADYTKAQPGQEFSKDGGAWTLCYKSAYLKDGKLHIKGYVTNNTSEERYIHYYNLDVTTRIIHDGAQTDSPWMSEFTAPEQYMVDYDTICVPAGETIAIESVSSEHYGQVHFAGIRFTVSAGYGPDGRPTGEEEKAYWIDFSEYLN